MRLRAARIALLTMVAASAGLAPFALLEAGLRIRGYGYPASFFVPVRGTPYVTTNQRFGRRFFPPQLARTPVADRFPARKAPGTYRIFVLGESAAMGFPEPGFSFARRLEAMLARTNPGRRFEVVQAAMTAINSHAVLPIARDCARFEPDLFIVYCGNNEFVGPYGAATVFTRSVSSLSLIRASVWLTGTRTGQWFGSLLRRGDQPAEWRGMEMFLRRTVPAGDPRIGPLYENFRRNLVDVCRVGRRAGARIILSTVAVNLKGTPPFASALATARFERGKALLAAGSTDEAAREFAAARDLDELRFRADSTINRIIREVAGGENVTLADAEAAFGRNSIPGNDLFYEHVHLNSAGNDLLARVVLPAAVASLPGLGAAEPPDPETVSRDLVLTGWDDYRSRADVQAMMERPPFSRPRVPLPPPAAAALDGAKSAYAAAILSHPDDLYIRQRYADLLSVRNEPAAAEEQWRQLIARLPDVDSWHIALGSVLLSAGKLEEALGEYRGVLRADRWSAAAQFGIGTVLQRRRASLEAAEAYKAALRLNPDYAEAENNLGLLRFEAGDAEGAVTHYRKALALKPDYSDSRFNLAEVLRRRAGSMAGAGDLQGARAALEEAVALTPALAATQYDLGTVFSRMGRHDEAAARFGEAVRLQPSYPEAWNNLGAALARRGELKRAAACFRKALELRPNFAAAQANLAAATGR